MMLWNEKSYNCICSIRCHLSNCRCTSGRAEWNSRRSRILVVANIWVAHAHVNKPHVLNGNIKWVYPIGTRTHSVQRSLAFLEARRAIIVWIIGRKRGNGLEVPCRHVKWQLIKLEGLLHNKVTASQFFVNLIFSKPLFTSTREFNRCHSQIEAAQNCVRK